MVLLGEIFPNFEALTNEGLIDFHEWIGDSWAILFSHPYDFTPICTTELAKVVKLIPEFKNLGVKVIGLSCNSLESHIQWIEDIKFYAGTSEEKFPYPIIADESRVIAKQLGMVEIDDDSNDMPLTARAVFIIDPKKRMRLSILYPATAGRNFSEIIRVIESLQLTDSHKLGTPVDWKNGEEVIIPPTLSDAEAQEIYGKNIKTVNVPSGKNYMRFVQHPVEALSKKKMNSSPE